MNNIHDVKIKQEFVNKSDISNLVKNSDLDKKNRNISKRSRTKFTAR